ncbi:hypothetical protein [Zhenhengia yiwuensis]|uniref:Uncharacterized protein n=1 Tax=Zhenhengia yiwuensis TaxID=2763666 RepID=A0A926EP21_9FIRM|nr:hypothetical protein [Zhenhengia yiwuensis]MBC8581568.1 hypothetical protein [Zhenhengia yiwuensis]MDU6360697.1 hypothetical protein [Clostridiales bacterium]MDY3367843.1 hypothetical protein [Zhenhengia yiwuensis]
MSEVVGQKDFISYENSIVVNIDDIIGKTPTEVMRALDSLLEQKYSKNGNDIISELKILKKENEILQCQNEELKFRLKEAQEHDEKRLEMMELKDTAEQLVAIIRQRYDSHTSIIVQSDGIKVVQDMMYIPLK